MVGLCINHTAQAVLAHTDLQPFNDAQGDSLRRHARIQVHKNEAVAAASALPYRLSPECTDACAGMYALTIHLPVLTWVCHNVRSCIQASMYARDDLL